MRALLYIELRLLLNAFKTTLRTPKRLIPMLFMLAWMGLIVVQNVMMVQMGREHPDYGRSFPTTSLASGIFLMLIFLSVQTIFRSFGDGLLVFQLSQIDFLFPTPVPKKAVLVIKLLRDYVILGFSMGFFLLVFSPFVVARVGAPLFPGLIIGWVGVVLLLSTITNLSHTLNIVLSFRMDELKLVSRLLKGLFYFLLAVGLVTFLMQARNGSALDALNAVAHSAVARFLFLPFAWTTGLMLYSLLPPANASLHLAALAGLSLLSFALLVSRPENIYEPSLAISARAAKIKSARRRGDMSAVIAESVSAKATGKEYTSPIPPFGHGAAALFWKNAVVALRKVKVTTIVWVIAVVTFLIVGRYLVVGHSNGFLWLTPALYALWIGTQMSQREMRSELGQANVLKAMPIAGWKVILAQVCYHSVVVMTGVFLLLGALLVVMPGNKGHSLLLGVLAIPSVVAAAIAGASVAAPLYPDLKDVSQNMLSNLIGTVLASISIIGSLVGGIVLTGVGISVFAIAGAITAFNLAFFVVAVALAGLLYNKFDPTSE